MKRKKNLYKNTYKLENIESAFNEVCMNTHNKKKVASYILPKRYGSFY